jgi:putative flippase GtrA
MSRFLRYCAVGAVATAVHYGLLVAGVVLAGWSAWLCAGIGAVAGAQVAFVGNRAFTFSGQPRRTASWLRFQYTALIGALVNMALVAAAVRLGWHYLLGQVLATALVVVLTFGINRRWTFA